MKKKFSATRQRGKIKHCIQAQVFNNETGLSVCSFNSTENSATATNYAITTAKALNNKNIDKWISVKDSLPVLDIYVRNGRHMRKVSEDFVVFDGEDVFIDQFNMDFGFHKSVTHWHPFPSAPKKPIK